MGYRYIVLVDTRLAPPNQQPTPHALAATLQAMGMHACFACGPMTLFVSNGTPTLATPGGAVVLGHLFSSDGVPMSAETLPAISDPQQFGQHLLLNCWGEYLLIQPFEPGLPLEIFRDPSGGVPCLYSIQDGVGFITSDIALATGIGLYHKQIDWEFIAQALAYSHLKTERTGLIHVRELLPGCSMAVRGKSVAIRQEWSPWTFVDANHRHSDPHEAAAEVRNAVSMVVQAWTATDRSILLELSGGLDSSIVAACLKGSNSRVACCTLVTPVPGADERRYAGIMADHLGTTLRADELGFERARFDFALPWQPATPRVGLLQYATNTVKEEVGDQLEITSFFSGGGGDIVFGYLGNAVPAIDAFKERGVMAAIGAIRNLSTLHQCTLWKASWLTLRKSYRGAKAPCKADRAFLDASRVADPPEQHPWFAAPINALPGDRERIAGLAGTQVFRDGAMRGTARWLRLPLLSQPVMEACLKVPTWMCISEGHNRAVARAAFADTLPPDILNRRSKGSFTNYCGGAYQRNKHQMRDFLLAGRLQEQRLLDGDALRCFFASPRPPRDHSFMRIFDLCMIENWVRRQS